MILIPASPRSQSFATFNTGRKDYATNNSTPPTRLYPPSASHASIL